MFSNMLMSNKAVAPPPIGGNYWTDSFTDVAGTLITAHIPEVGSGGYTIGSGACTIDAANTAALNAAPTSVAFNTGNTNVIISADYVSGSMPGLILRYVDSLNYAILFLIASNTFRIYERVAGAFNQKTNVTAPFVTGDRFALSDDGTTLRGYLNGVLVTSFATTLNNTYGVHGLYSYGIANMDNLSVDAI